MSTSRPNTRGRKIGIGIDVDFAKLTSPYELFYNEYNQYLAERLTLVKGVIMVVYETKEFGKAIRNRRKELGYTQTYISEFSGLSISFISDLENGKKTIELGKAIYLANLLGMDVELIARGHAAL